MSYVVFFTFAAVLTAGSVSIWTANKRSQQSERGNYISLRISKCKSYNLNSDDREPNKIINVYDENQTNVYRFLKVTDKNEISYPIISENSKKRNAWIFYDLIKNEEISRINFRKVLDDYIDFPSFKDMDNHVHSCPLPVPIESSHVAQTSEETIKPDHCNDFHWFSRKKPDLADNGQSKVKNGNRGYSNKKTSNNEVLKIYLKKKTMGNYTEFRLRKQESDEIVCYRWVRSSGYLEKIRNENMEYDEIHERIALAGSRNNKRIDFLLQIDTTRAHPKVVICTAFMQIISNWDKRTLKIKNTDRVLVT